MSRVKLASIKALTFYKDELTESRRTSPIPQLVCAGKPCKTYQPEVVHCKNIGGIGLDVDWKCEADLPEALRFGKVMVSCEGWSGPGDPYVLKDSCSVEYRLVEIPKDLRGHSESYHTSGTKRKPSTRIHENDLKLKKHSAMDIVFTVAWVAVLLFIFYSFLKSCLQTRETSSTGSSRGNRPEGAPRPGGGDGRFPGYYDNNTGRDPPPPYSKTQNTEPWRPGFWTGALAGGLADRYLFRNNETGDRQRRQWDWEQSRRPTTFFGGGPGRTGSTSNSADRAEGPSNLGSVRRSTGFGGSSVR
ncbi:DUF1183-domain-containing protein [Lentinula aff. detonsa]|uniref:Store-operated calcium entry-associated regulatory factor n=1 Tax=Lentinula aff. detonsa TaxID=2804958 RepID=A0AA38KFA0_9AGAR|nr:DUF1183-domain-containing protein [Lentinula aff. detonsa]